MWTTHFVTDACCSASKALFSQQGVFNIDSPERGDTSLLFAQSLIGSFKNIFPQYGKSEIAQTRGNKAQRNSTNQDMSLVAAPSNGVSVIQSILGHSPPGMTEPSLHMMSVWKKRVDRTVLSPQYGKSEIAQTRGNKAQWNSTNQDMSLVAAPSNGVSVIQYTLGHSPPGMTEPSLHMMSVWKKRVDRTVLSPIKSRYLKRYFVQIPIRWTIIRLFIRAVFFQFGIQLLGSNSIDVVDGLVNAYRS